MSNEQIIKNFPSPSTWYYINKDGTIKDFIVNSELSSHGAYILSKVFVLYSTSEEASNALKEFNKAYFLGLYDRLN